MTDPAAKGELVEPWRLRARRQGGLREYVLRKVRLGVAEPFYERLALQALGIDTVKGPSGASVEAQ